MQYGICHLSIIPVRSTPDEVAEMVTQLLFGEHFKVLESRKNWSRIKTLFDKCEGWIMNNQLVFIPEDEFNTLKECKEEKLAAELITYVEDEHKILTPILIGSSIPNTPSLPLSFDGVITSEKQSKDNIVRTALLYLNSPEVKGGRTPFGIDAAGFAQMVYKINGYKLLRTAERQSTQGDALSFVEESEAGDLAFFDNSSGSIDHVGIIMENNYVIHVHGKVRIDRLDHTGIFNNDLRTYTHQLRVIKKVI
ncbi:NlpC/P60 family protein [Maribacter confluentis]|uniref:SH3 domain-containing protein n=2 Tax=Maribacter TaxID=252356 RepID=A0ABY1SEW0_9FLAO|nr:MULTISPECIES: NlpC/P60 family protein [Maribacter]MDO1511686.1 NlpC/P60 family protein [Maribacter confluentis]SNR39414.1 SH3 domain-containing protein [Maribacter sedimenticola]